VHYTSIKLKFLSIIELKRDLSIKKLVRIIIFLIATKAY